MQDRIEITVTDGVADVRLVRSDKMNALDAAMFKAIEEAGEQLRNDPSVRVAVLSGEGKAFCAGLDMANFAAMAEGGKSSEHKGGAKAVPKTLAERTHGIANQPQYAGWMWRELPMPVIAAVHGVALGGGLQVCLGADIRYAAPGTRLSVMEIKWGLVPDMAGTQLMRHLLRDDVVRELSYSGRIFTAEEALTMGLVTAVVEDPYEHAMTLARQIAGRNPDAIRANKRMFNAANYLSAEDGLMMESVEQDAIIGTPNQIEAVMAELEKRPAHFKD
ncbi:crotonase/enoyl-CoA hydratase family protein [Halieaceae bacterium IMCC14734]|uniref:Crotonase/enoyl-CoA hydratase family protein n=1 Tax=Candidatus Litorirhabdus singularis TaxID=2518993 RepID=A0ABT3TIS9_9GAMM|nr:crotonase/enoyl-CoA hydratase family protein [Candidatus Litorirhabdus singularis]MCX2982191.1 crotonase/enoyl-CoA hydratase family protein [Candidatus Litorirhabdus singularis]